MPTFKVPFTKVLDILPHPNADKLSVAKIYDFNVIIRKDQYKIGDEVIFIPPDSIIPEWLENKLFDKDSKIKLDKRRIRQIRIRGFASQGMIINPNEFENVPQFDNVGYPTLEDDVSEALGIIKYEPPQTDFSANIGKVKKRNKALENCYFHKFGGIDNIKWYPNLFEEEETVYITEKLHGTNARYGWVPWASDVWYKKLLKFLHLAPSHEFCWGSNNVQIQNRSNYEGFYKGYEEDIYTQMIAKYDLKKRLRPGEVIYGEIIGPGIQKNYDYGLKEHKLVLFDLKWQTETSSEFASPIVFKSFCDERGFERVPELYKGPYNKDLAYSLTFGPSVYEPKQKIREGIVIKPIIETTTGMGRKVLKWLSEDYLNDRTNSDNH